jgi:aspartyl-tRNA(Asn)/glutamyl-tRNA(Gln) amidotransferase subunit A
MDHVAPMAATVGDVSVMLGVLHDDPTVAVTGRMPAGLRVGLPEATLAGADEEVATIAVAAVEALVASTGARLLRTRQPSGGDLELAGAAGLIVSRCEAAAFHRSLGLDRFLYWAEVAAQLDAADEVRATDYLDAQRARGQLADKLLGCFDGVDLLAMPTTLTVAPLAADYEGHLMTLARNAIPWSFVGFPAVSIPVGRAGGLPVGLQLVAPPHGEGLLLAAGLAVERVVGLLPPVPIRR